MVRGLGRFKDFFSVYADQYVLIGGAACDLLMEAADLEFRNTKDLDIVLCIEVLDAAFTGRFWEFIRLAGYQVREKANGKKCYYRFQKPASVEYPFMLELFSRLPDALDESGIVGITPVPVNDKIISLSAILLDEAYYQLINTHKVTISGIPIVSVECLIPLKAKAWLDLTNRKSSGEDIDANSISKHKNDTFRLFQLLGSKKVLNLPDIVKTDMDRFITLMTNEDVNVRQLGIKTMGKDEILTQLRMVYGILLV